MAKRIECGTLLLISVCLLIGSISGDHVKRNNCPSNLPRSTYVSSYEHSCIQIVPFRKSWADARRDCQSHGGDLTHITDEIKQSFIMSQLEHNFPQKVWIGATDQDKESKWMWVTGELINGHYGNWKTNNGPAHVGSVFSRADQTDCALLDYFNGGQWQEYLCNSTFFKYNYICEYVPGITRKPTRPITSTVEASSTTHITTNKLSKAKTPFVTSLPQEPTTIHIKTTKHHSKTTLATSQRKEDITPTLTLIRAPTTVRKSHSAKTYTKKPQVIQPQKTTQRTQYSTKDWKTNGPKTNALKTSKNVPEYVIGILVGIVVIMGALVVGAIVFKKIAGHKQHNYNIQNPLYENENSATSYNISDT